MLLYIYIINCGAAFVTFPYKDYDLVDTSVTYSNIQAIRTTIKMSKDYTLQHNEVCVRDRENLCM